MRYAIQKKFTMFDFTIGDERYKLDWCDHAGLSTITYRF